MFIEYVLDFDRTNIFAARNNDVFGTVLQLNVPIGMHHPEITACKPTTTEGLFRGRRIFQVSFHHIIAAHEDLTHGFTIPRAWLQRLRVSDHQALGGKVADPLTGLQRGTLRGRLRVPFAVPGTGDGRTVSFGQTVTMCNLKSLLFHFFDNDRRRRCTASQDLDARMQADLHVIRRMDQ